MLPGSAFEGDGESRGRLFERFRPHVVLWAATRLPPGLGGRLAPAEFAEDVLRRSYRRFHEFSGKDCDAFLTWLIARAESRLGRLLADPEEEAPPTDRGGLPPITREEVARMCQALQGLDQEHRDVLRLCRFERRSPEDAAGPLGCTPADVRLLYYRALKALGQAMDGSRA